MKSTLLSIFLLALAGAGAAWHYKEAEIREWLGWPEAISKPPEIVTNDPDLPPSKRGPKSKPKDSTSTESDSGPDPVTQRIEEIVRERYPDLPTQSFDAMFPDMAHLPTESYPERVTVKNEVQFKKLNGNSLLAASYVKPGGQVVPVKLEDGTLTVMSLADNRMQTGIPLADTDFELLIRNNYLSSTKDAADRIQKMRDADRSDLKGNQMLYRKLAKQGTPVWKDADDRGLLRYETSMHRSVDREKFNLIGWFPNGRIGVKTDSGTKYHDEIILLLEGMDRGFGPYLWRVKGKARGTSINWEGLP